MINILKNLYISYYFYSLKINGKNAFHNCYACLALTFLELIVFCNLSMSMYFLFGFSLLDSGFIDDTILPVSILIVVFFVNYGFFTVGYRFKGLVEGVNDKDKSRLKFYGVKVFIASSAILLFLVVMIGLA